MTWQDDFDEDSEMGTSTLHRRLQRSPAGTKSELLRVNENSRKWTRAYGLVLIPHASLPPHPTRRSVDSAQTAATRTEVHVPSAPHSRRYSIEKRPSSALPAASSSFLSRRAAQSEGGRSRSGTALHRDRYPGARTDESQCDPPLGKGIARVERTRSGKGGKRGYGGKIRGAARRRRRLTLPTSLESARIMSDLSTIPTRLTEPYITTS